MQFKCIKLHCEYVLQVIVTCMSVRHVANQKLASIKLFNCYYCFGLHVLMQ